MKKGDYVRTEGGEIGKVVSEPYEYKDIMGCDIELGNGDIYNEYDLFDIIIKSSSNIIDLIEVGDYVNGYKVLRIEKDYLFDYSEEINVLIVQNDEVYEVAKKIYSDEIKSIVTKEQFSSMEYKV